MLWSTRHYLSSTSEEFIPLSLRSYNSPLWLYVLITFEHSIYCWGDRSSSWLCIMRGSLYLSALTTPQLWFMAFVWIHSIRTAKERCSHGLSVEGSAVSRSTDVMEKNGPDETGGTLSCFSLTASKGMMREEGCPSWPVELGGDSAGQEWLCSLKNMQDQGRDNYPWHTTFVCSSWFNCWIKLLEKKWQRWNSGPFSLGTIVIGAE